MAGTFIGFLPLLGWNTGDGKDEKCFFVKVMDYKYLVFLYFATIITPAVILAAFYAHIYRVVLKQLRQIVTMNPGRGNNGAQPNSGGTMLRMLGAAQKREVKATQNLSIIVLFFMICWLPLYTHNCIQAFCTECDIGETLTNFFIILSHLNSAVNPLLYAYHLRDFRAALKYFILGLCGIKEQAGLGLDRNCRPSIASNNYSLCRMQQLRNRSPDARSAYKQQFRNLRDDKMVPICVPIVKSTAAVAAVSAGERGMWMIAEVPSASASENNFEREGAVFPDAGAVPDQSDSGSSGMVNSAFMESAIDDLEMGDDDVFYADVSVSGTNSDASEIFKRSDRPAEITSRTKRNSRTWCLSSSSPQLFRSLFYIDDQVKNGGECSERKKQKSVTLSSGDPSPARSLKISSFKAVGDFLLQHTSSKHSKCTKKCDEEPKDRNAKNSLAVVPYVFNKNGMALSQSFNANDS